MTQNIGERFKDPAHVASYAERPKKIVPGFEGLHRIMAQLIAEAAPRNVLVLGGGGGLETRTLLDRLPESRFCAVDPSAEMIAQGRAYLNDDPRVDWVEGLIDEAPAGPFDAATCLLVLHFIPDDGTKLETLKAVRARLKPGAPFFAAHISIDRDDPASDRRYRRYLQFAADSGLEPDMQQKHADIRTHLNSVGPERDEQLLREAGFSDIELVFKGLYWCGWIACA